MGLEGLPVHHKDHIAVDALIKKPLQEVIVVVPPPAGGCHLLIITQDPADVITCSPIEAALALENVGLAVGS